MLTELPILAQASSQTDKLLVGLRIALPAALALALLVFGRRDLRRLSAGRLWALAVQTFRESVRKRVLLLIPAAMLLVVAIGAFQRSLDEVGDIHQATELCIRTASALTILLVVLLAAFSFPNELETRTIHTLLSKPVTRLEVFLGKLLGLWLVGLLVLGVMGVFSYAYLWQRSSRLVGQAEARLDQQKQQYEAYVQASRLATTQPEGGAGAEPALASVAPTVAPRYEPPDAALAQMAEMGLLAAMNYVEPSGPVLIAPQVPAPLAAGRWRWMLASRGYQALYEVKLPPPEQRGHEAPLSLLVAMPDLPADASPQLRVQVYSNAVPVSERVPLDRTPTAATAAGWLLALGDPMVMRLRRTEDRGGVVQQQLGLPESVGLWDGTLNLTGEFLQALGPVETIAFAISPQDPRQLPPGQLIGLLPPGEPQAAESLILNVAAPRIGVYVTVAPSGFHLLPRVQAMRQLPLPGSAPGEPPEVARYSFTGIDQADLPPGDLVFQLQFEIQKGTLASVVTEAMVEVTNPQVGGELLVLTAYPTGRMGSFVRVPRSFAAGGKLNVSIRPRYEDDLFGLRDDSVRLLGAPTSFAFNLLKSLAICAIQSLLVVGIGVMASVFLSWPVALLLTSTVLVAGNLLDMVRGIVNRPSVQIFEVSGTGRPLDLVGQAANVFVAQASRVINFVIPDFTEFNPVAYIGQGLNIPLSSLADLWQAPIYLFVAVVIGYLALHFKEVGR